MRSTAGAEEQVPVLIVGGGGAGLTSSMLLARLGVEHLLVSARPQTSDLPKAHVLNQRAMEVLDDAGVAGAIAERSTPPEQMAATAFYAGFADPGPDYGRRLARLESWAPAGRMRTGRRPARGARRTCRRSAWSRCSRPGPRSSRRGGSGSAMS